MVNIHRLYTIKALINDVWGIGTTWWPSTVLQPPPVGHKPRQSGKVALLWMVMVETESNGNTISFGSGTTGLVIHIFGVTAHQT
jgi:hypothetical protein